MFFFGFWSLVYIRLVILSTVGHFRFRFSPSKSWRRFAFREDANTRNI